MENTTVTTVEVPPLLAASREVGFLLRFRGVPTLAFIPPWKPPINRHSIPNRLQLPSWTPSTSQLPAAEERDNSRLIIVAAVVVVIGVLLALAFLLRQPPKKVEPPSPYIAQLKLSNFKMSAAENFIGSTVSYIDGDITNTSDKTVTRVMVEVNFQDSMGQLAQREELPLRMSPHQRRLPRTRRSQCRPLSPRPNPTLPPHLRQHLRPMEPPIPRLPSPTCHRKIDFECDIRSRRIENKLPSFAVKDPTLSRCTVLDFGGKWPFSPVSPCGESFPLSATMLSVPEAKPFRLTESVKAAG